MLTWALPENVGPTISNFDYADGKQDEPMPDQGDARPQRGGAGTNHASAQLLLQNGQEVNASLIDAFLDTDSFLVSEHSGRGPYQASFLVPGGQSLFCCHEPIRLDIVYRYKSDRIMF